MIRLMSQLTFWKEAAVSQLSTADAVEQCGRSILRSGAGLVRYGFSFDKMERAVITFRTKIEKLEQRSYKVWMGGHGKDAVFEDIPIGWFMHIQGSGEALYVGDAKPDMNVGDEVVLSISRV